MTHPIIRLPQWFRIGAYHPSGQRYHAALSPKSVLHMETTLSSYMTAQACLATLALVICLPDIYPGYLRSVEFSFHVNTLAPLP